MCGIVKIIDYYETKSVEYSALLYIVFYVYKLLCGVPQGRILGLLLVSVYKAKDSSLPGFL